ncbi:hypothetical protein HJB79_28920 [Rhizobium lentis]|uniref:hypothetical protein n=1 Tax=Rhizobium TaxID=379 RepID=UPI00161E4BA4|nr:MULTISPECIES: hypothetical protein [Rhizobium]MBB3355499.1 hypothetical protein [Rhizobium sp. BK049]MBX5136542.1 hypothetical protein [Rhizobium lentis]MBX5142741.1 hypothetical protein [Rhizobium lentis]MBX5154663.1 hypothetical protein [Rhizobium lentis]MBX5179904.1 hypothetical protein [Rhizobium lentis]
MMPERCYGRSSTMPFAGRRSAIRDFGGYEIGKRRKPDVIDAIADEVAEFLCTYLDIKAHGRPAKKEALILGVRQIAKATIGKRPART